jgi:NADPH-dependent 2,4-dienoyl-CoA reductase/sulfur reductase-like enzyme/predicted acylesterase/phospholipase RssA
MCVEKVDFLLLGGGPASATAAWALRLEGAAGSIRMLSAEDVLPYDRSPLSKQYLLGRLSAAQLTLYPEAFYRSQDIEVQLNTRVAGVDPDGRVVEAASGERFHYGQLLIATGGVSRRLAVPGADLAGVHYLRTRASADSLRQAALSGARRAIVVGASLLGVEVATTLVGLGLTVTVIEEQALPLSHLESPAVSDALRRQMEKRGATVVLGDRPAQIVGADKVEAVVTDAGLRLACDLIVVCIGSDPNCGFLAGGPIVLQNGYIRVDDRLRTNVPGVYAAGDVTCFFDPVFGRYRTFSHWDNAVKQARIAAKNMVGRRVRQDDVAYYFFDVGDVSLTVLGDTSNADERVARGSLEAGSLALFYLAKDVPQGLLSTGRPPQETRAVEGLIRQRVGLGRRKARLADPAFDLGDIPTQTVLILQGGGALGAFECGVIKGLEEARIFPDVVAGVSIGAVNGAIVAANPRHAAAALEAFWADITLGWTTLLPPGEGGRALAALQVLLYGVPHFFTPRWLEPFGPSNPLPADWTSFYDPEPLKKLIAAYVDFDALKTSPVRLLVGAVNVKTAEFEIFDSHIDELTPDHILASGSLPPGFPWTVIDGKPYWDGGIVSNSPLDFAIERCGPGGKRVFVVDLFPGESPLPTNMMEVMARRDEVIYAERVRSDLRYREMVDSYRRLIAWIMAEVDATHLGKIMHLPLFVQLMGDGAQTTITRFVRAASSGSASRDYDFSAESIGANKTAGYEMVKAKLGAEGHSRRRAARSPASRT